MLPTSLHTGVRTSTVSAEWRAWDVPFRLVVTDPTALRTACELVERQLGQLAAVVGHRPAGPARHSALTRLLCGGTPTPTGEASSFPYGIAGVPRGVEAHRPATTTWQQAFASATRAREGWRVEGCPSAWAMIAQRCAQLVADATSCGALVAFGDDVATSGLAPLGGWRVELSDTSGAHRPGEVVAIDGGAISSTSSACAHHGAGRRTLLLSMTAPTPSLVWQSVTVAAADAPTASAACSRAMLWGEDAPALLALMGLPALLIDPAGIAHAAGSWPGAGGPDRRAEQKRRATVADSATGRPNS